MFTGSSNKYIYVISTDTMQTMLRLKGHTRLVSALDADLTHVLSGSVDKTVRFWSQQGDREGWTCKQEAIMRGHFVKVWIDLVLLQKKSHVRNRLA